MVLIKPWPWGIADGFAPLGLPGMSCFDVRESGGQEALHTGDTVEPKIHSHQCRRICPCKIHEQTGPGTWDM